MIQYGAKEFAVTVTVFKFEDEEDEEDDSDDCASVAGSIVSAGRY